MAESSGTMLNIAETVIDARAQMDDHIPGAYLLHPDDPEGYVPSILNAMHQWCDAHDLDWEGQLELALDYYEDDEEARMDWWIDGKINLTALCKEADWHRQSAIDALKARGIGHDDAEAFVAFAFADEAENSDDPESMVTDEQYARLSVRDGDMETYTTRRCL